MDVRTIITIVSTHKKVRVRYTVRVLADLYLCYKEISDVHSEGNGCFPWDVAGVIAQLTLNKSVASKESEYYLYV